VNAIARQSDKRAAFTIIELLTVMSVIIILIGLIVPSLNKFRRFARKVTQKNQFHAIGTALDLFNVEWEGYPDSSATDDEGEQYCGAMKLCEALVGQDLLGFHPDSRFRRSDISGIDGLYNTGVEDNLKSRKDYLPAVKANAFKMLDLYPEQGPFNAAASEMPLFVLCDMYKIIESGDTGKLVGMPILYYRANTANTGHEVDAANNIYDYRDNHSLTLLGMQWKAPILNPESKHTLFTNPEVFYEKTVDKNITSANRPHRSDSYILLSAGFDGEYGTSDDVFNFGN